MFMYIGDGKCVLCDSLVHPCTLVRICDECNYGSYQGRCTVCGGPGVSDAYYCKECTICEKDVSANYHINNHITEFWGWLIKKMPEVGSYLVVNDVKSRD